MNPNLKGCYCGPRQSKYYVIYINGRQIQYYVNGKALTAKFPSLQQAKDFVELNIQGNHFAVIHDDRSKVVAKYSQEVKHVWS